MVALAVSRYTSVNGTMMPQEWAPSIWGRLLTGSQRWRLRLVNESLELEVNGQLHRAAIDESSPPRVHRGLFWTDLTLQLGLPSLARVDGLPKVRTQEIEDAFSTVLAAQQRRKRQETFNKAFAQIQVWLAEVDQWLGWAKDKRRWITHEQQQALLRRRPSLSISEDALWKLFRDPDVRPGLPKSAESVEKCLQAWQADWPAAWAGANEQHMLQELVACKDLLDRVESKPLTLDERRRDI